jgi:glycerophosphoryl diester phosphodiesterase
VNAPGWLVARPIAHRGLHDASAGRIENTRAAFAAAIDGGFAMECDLQLSRDGEAMVFHDGTLDRLTGRSGRVDALDAAELADIAITGAGESIPTFADLLGLVAGRMPLVVEIKSAFTGDLRLTERAVALAAQYDGPLCFKSFDPAIVVSLRRLCPERPRGIVAMAFLDGSDERASAEQRRSLGHLLHFNESEPDFISWRVDDLPHAAPFFCRSVLGRPVMAWTVRTPEQRAMVARHADQMVFEGFLP